ncbi:helicase-related protein [Nocardioides sp. Root140]|uniref:helicase-related protein n=1 Tax=Nocardioides sp. Root140 TaxID=1736460 RepID=UPI001F171946|nr:helicase-related protein [Nocardioides sp. Root140]
MTIGTKEQFAAPGSVLEIRDETWLVTRAERATDGWFYEVTGLSELVRGTNAIFSDALDDIRVLDPELATVKVDLSPGFMQSKVWLEATLRKTAVPLTQTTLTVSTQGLADSLPYQLAAVRQALDPENLRPRILLADAVGLGKTLEIGMILAELVRRGRGERILVVTPKHVLEQTQFELWTRFALPFVRLDSLGIQRIRQLLPANRNPFAHFKRAIVSIDTLKSDRYLAHLEKQQWDAVVIDESHNVTNDSTQNNRLARLLSRKTDALILASATPHNGRKESFAELIRMLDPSAVTPTGDLIEDEVRRLVIRRHRHSQDVASIVGSDWAERHEPHNILVKANAIEDAIADELEHTWLHPEAGASPYSGGNARLFPWTLAKAFLSSPAALSATVGERLKKLGDEIATAKEREALSRLGELADRSRVEGSAKYDALVTHLREIGIKSNAPDRVVIFAERVSTLHWLQARLVNDFKLKDDQVVVLHGGISDIEQQAVVESFKQESSPIRILVTGDVASEGVNLHLQCHELVHYDIPWSLIRIEQRNGRIDRYGQRHRPRITTLLLDPSTSRFGGDIRVLQKLVEKEHEAHQALGDSASLMGQYDVKAEEDAIRDVLAGKKDLDDVVKSVEEAKSGGGIDAMLARLFALGATTPEPTIEAEHGADGVYDTDLAFLRDALEVSFATPAAPVAANGVAWREFPNHALVEFVPTDDLRQRLEVLPQSYLRERKVVQGFKLATTLSRGKQALADARSAESNSLWPEAHYLSPLHPSLEWAADRALENLGRNEVFALSAPGGGDLGLLLHGSLTNAKGQVVASTYVVARFPEPTNPDFVMPQPFATVRDALHSLGADGALVNTNALKEHADLDAYVGPAVRAARVLLDQLLKAASESVTARVDAWNDRVSDWQASAALEAQRLDLKERRLRVEDEKAIAESMRPDQLTVRPLLLVLPTAGGSN